MYTSPDAIHFANKLEYAVGLHRGGNRNFVSIVSREQVRYHGRKSKYGDDIV